MKYVIGLLPILGLLFILAYFVILVVRRVNQEKEFKLKLEKLREELDKDE